MSTGIMKYFLIAVLIAPTVLSCGEDAPSVPLDGVGHYYECIGEFHWNDLDCVDPNPDDSNYSCDGVDGFTDVSPLPRFRKCANPGSSPEVINAMTEWCIWKCEETYKRWVITSDFPFFQMEVPGECVITGIAETFETCNEDSAKAVNGLICTDTHVPYVVGIGTSDSSAIVNYSGYIVEPVITGGTSGYYVTCEEGDDCSLELVDLRVSMADFNYSIEDYSIPVRDIVFRLNATAVGEYNNNTGRVVFPPDSFEGLLEFEIDGDYGNAIGSNDSDIVGYLNPITNTVELEGEIPDAGITFELKGGYLHEPPEVRLSTPAAPVECDGNYSAGVLVSSDGTHDPQGGDVEQWWWVESDEVILMTDYNNSNPILAVPMGNHAIYYRVQNDQYVSVMERRDVTVVDTTPPTIQTPVINETICVPNAVALDIDAPVVADVCTSVDTITVQGFLHSMDEVYAGDVPILDGHVTLSEGTHMLKWIATDEFGNSTTAYQTVIVTFEVSVDCCEEDQTLWEGTPKKDKFFDNGHHYPNPKPAWCVIGYEQRDKARLFSGGGSYVALGEGRDSAILWDWQDYGMSTVVGEGGDDTIHIKHHSAQVYGGDGDDMIHLWEGENLVYGGYGDDVIEEGIGNDVIIPGPGQDYVIASFGDDTVWVYSDCELEPGEILDGGEGNDTLYLPIPVEEVESMGVQIYSFENILMTEPTLEGLSDCI